MGFTATAADSAKAPQPSYDKATVVEISATVKDVKIVDANLHLFIEKGSETLDIFVGPTEFVKIFDVTFSKGDKIVVIGSKVPFEGSTVVLAREVTLGSVTLVCRDKDGEPLWKFFIKPPVG
jgi:hypothetical protein